MDRLLVVVAAAAGITIAAPVLAQEPAPVPRAEYVMEATVVDGTLVGPNGEVFGARPPADTGSLLRIRTTFVPEMVKTVEQI